MLKGEIGLMQYFVNYCHDIYCTHGLEILSYEEMLYRCLKEDKYERIVFFKNNGDGFISECFDEFSRLSFLNPMKAKELFDCDHVEESKKKIIKALDVGEQASLFSNQQQQKTKAYKKIKDYATFVGVLKTNIKNCIEDEKMKTAIIFPSEMKKYFNNQTSKENHSNIDLYFQYLDEHKANGNIIAFTFDNLGDFAKFGSECDDAFPIFKKIGTDSHGINYLEKEHDYVKLYREMFGDSLHLFLEPSVDEISNLIQRFVLKNHFDLSYQDIEIIATVLKEDMNKKIKEERFIKEFSLNPHQPLSSIQNQLLQKENQSSKQIQENYQNLKKYIQHYKEHNTIDDVHQMVGIESFLEHIDQIKKSYAKIQRKEVKLHDNDLTRLGQINEEDELPISFKLSLNTVFLGNPGTGKTTLARIYGRILKEMGILKSGHCNEVSKSSLKGEYVGQSIAKMNQAIQNSEGGVLFIDEFYTFSKKSKENVNADYDQEIVETILTAAVNPNIHVVFVLAGYEKQTLDVLQSYEGLESRFPSYIRLKDYSSEDMYHIVRDWIKEKNLHMSSDFENNLLDFISNWRDDRYSHPTKEWANVRTLSNEFFQPLCDHSQGTLTRENIPQELKKYDCPHSDYQQTVYNQLDHLIGLNNIKKELKAIIETISVIDQNIRLKYFQYNYIFAGNPGVGKTMVAGLLGKIAASHHIIECGRTIQIHLENYLGHANASELLVDDLNKCIGNVAFIDEAYRIDPQRQLRSDVRELYDALMKFMEDHKGELFIIMAGYYQEMKNFLEGNPGMPSRVSKENFIVFDDYSTDELLQILEMYLKSDHIAYEPAVIEASRKKIDLARQNNPKNFGNARYVRDCIKEYLKNMSVRIHQDPTQERILKKEDVALPKQVKEKPNNDHIKYAVMVNELNRDSDVRIYQDDKDAFHEYYSRALLLLEVETENGSQATGTGFLVSASGLALTCAHVVNDATSITAVLKIKGRIGGEISRHQCQIVKMDENLDIALIQLEGDHFPTMKLASEDYRMKRGDPFVLFGYPMGTIIKGDYTAFEGTIASVGQNDGYGEICFINGEAKHGNSGGCVVSKDTGEVIGILTGAINGQDKAIDTIRYIRPIYYFWQNF